MRNYLRFLPVVVMLCAGTIFVTAQEVAKIFPPTESGIFNGGDGDKTDKDKKAAEGIKDPLIKILLSKGLITLAEAQALAADSSSNGQRDALAALLLNKGIISAAELDALRPANSSAPSVITASLKTAPTAEKATAANAAPSNAQAAPAVIPGIAPIRVLQLEGAKRDGLIPDIKLGSGAKVKLYGFFKAGVIYDSSSPGGNDFPLPGFLGDTGPNGSPEFHIKARALRLGANFEWLDPAPNLTLTGKIELDFEGDFTRTNNRNISSIRSSQPSLRLAWVRIDKTFNEKTSAHILFGQDWTPFGSSTVPNTIETTGFHLGYGNIYERAPQVRAGVNFLVSKNRNVRFQPEFAIVLPFFGNVPTDTGNQLGFGERQGVDSQRPEVQGRFVLQFQLDKAPGVAPAQLIASFTQGKRKAILRRQDVPAAFLAAFPRGAEVESDRYGYTAEFQLPTRYFTLIGKYYRGADLRAYFGGQLYSTYNDISGLTGVTTATSIDGSSTVAFGLRNGQPVIADQNPVRGQGGFINLGIPLSRLFNADPKGRAAGFTAYVHYGYDEASARDVRQILGATLNPVGAAANQFGANRGKSDVAFTSLQYKLNAFVTFAFEQSYFRTRAANNAGALPLFRGIPSRETHNNRSEFATIFNF
ncbi:MAG: hypothetical protein M3T96_02645 [Acidobacteriota bacterium]|nr:hypothetical protein [Acidobacteriota bacterium]